ncbi:brefeldin A-inhibited guanine nucleotide-exchange protein 1-like isoform X2 [Coffea arabica]|uniref:Brefeldin A-inhibited guanine nucleotide-exchange protein 1-like isoform X2 n=1 Tax=Coffea arabica TaxID=13443 RepID=A0A6P6U9T2_COFAR
MSTSSAIPQTQTLGGPSRCGRVLGPSLDKIIKNVAWRKHSQLVSACKSALDKLESLSDSSSDPASCTPLYGISSPQDADFVLKPLILALDSGAPKVVEPALDCVSRLFSSGFIRCEIATTDDAAATSLIFRLIDSACKCTSLGDEAVELAVLRLLLSAVRSPCVLIRGNCLVHIVRSCYNVYLGGFNGTNQICAKSVLAQMMVIIFSRVEHNSAILPSFRTVSVAQLLEFTDRNLNEGSSIQFAQNFIADVVEAKEVLPPPPMLHGIPSPVEKKSEFESESESASGQQPDYDFNGYSKITEDGFMLYKNICKLSMKYSSQEHQDDQILLRGKILSLELLKVIMDNAGPVWRTNERTVNGLLKTALGPPPGSTTTLSPVQDITFRLESVKCLVRIIKSMGLWMDQQLKVGELNSSMSENEILSENSVTVSEEVNLADSELHSEVNSEFSDAATLEQRRAYKLEIQKGVSLFNRKPSKGIEFLLSTKKVGSSPEAVASFLKNTSGLNETMIGDYLGEREDFPLKVMHAYVDSFDLEGMDFGEAIRFFLRGFRLPGEAQKIDRIMEKFAERYCKCSPNSFTSADTAYVLAYSVIMLNTDAHNTTVKDKMTKADFIRNNRGIDGGKDLPEEYLGKLYDQIVKNEIKMNADSSVPQSKQGNGLNRLLGLESILNLVWKQTEEKPMGANGYLIRHIQEQFKAKSGKSESTYYAVSDPAILRFMVEVCWGPMIAAFSVTLDQSDDKEATSQCLLGFRHAVHVTAVMGMQTQRDAFVTTVAKFTYLHCAADMKQKNVDAVKAIVSIAIEDGNYLQESWEHILTCLSRFEHLQLLGEGAPSDASFLTTANAETDEKALKSAGFPSLKKKGNLQNPAVVAVVRGGSYDSTSLVANSPGLVTSEQINNFIANLNLLDQIGNFELNHIFAHSQRLNSEAIVAFVRALCKVSMSELQSPTDPRVFSLTKIVEVAHYNMNRIRLVWSRIWTVLSDFFVSVGLSENLSVAIFVMDSLRQLSMKFLEREELANYNFQNEFLKPFVIVMQRSSSAEIRELIVRCISQMVLSRVSNVKSGWKSVFMVFTTAAADERKNIVLLAFETMEKIVREYFSYITETETLTFTDCVKCLITFTNSRFNSDVSLNAIAFLRFCAVKLADGGLVCNDERTEDASSMVVRDDNDSVGRIFTDKDDHAFFWLPLLSGLSELTSDPRSAIRKSALEVLFNILKDHGSLFSPVFWLSLFTSVIFPIFSSQHDKQKTRLKDDKSSPSSKSLLLDGSTWDTETSALAAEYLVDLFVSFFDVVRSELKSVVSILAAFIMSPVQGPARTGVATLRRLVSELRARLTEEEWRDVLLALKEAASSSLPGFLKLLSTMDSIKVPDLAEDYADMETSSSLGLINDESEDDNLQTSTYVVSRIKSHITAQLLIIQVASDLYKLHSQPLSADSMIILVEVFSSVATHAHQLNSNKVLQLKLQRVCCILEVSDPPMVHFENESYQNYLNFLSDLLACNPSLYGEKNMEQQLLAVCEKILQIYLECAGESVQSKAANAPVHQWNLPLGSAKKEELAARTPLVLSVFRILSGLERDCFRKYIPRLFPILVNFVRSEHSSGEVQKVLSSIFESCIGPLIITC